MEKYGNLLIEEKKQNLFYISKFRKVNFPECKELFEKGKKNTIDFFLKEMGNIPDITFWHQRYYYYQLFDQGIKMDKESIIII